MPIEFEISFEGYERLQRAIEVLGDRALNTLVADVAKDIWAQITGRTPVDTGALSKSWTPSGSGLLYSFENPMPYANIVEEGLYPEEWIHPGGRLVRTTEGVFSNYPTQFESRFAGGGRGGMATPVLEDEDYINDLIDQQTEAILNQIGRL